MCGKIARLFNAAAVLMMVSMAAASCIKDRGPVGERDLGPGDEVPQFCVEMNDGRTLCSDDLEGRVSVIVFFHTGCPDCEEELPVIQRIYDEFGERVTVCCISREESGDSIEAFWRANGLTLPYSAQESRDIYNLFATIGVPRVFVVSPDLIIYSAYDDSPIATYSDLLNDIIGAS